MINSPASVTRQEIPLSLLGNWVIPERRRGTCSGFTRSIAIRRTGRSFLIGFTRIGEAFSSEVRVRVVPGLPHPRMNSGNCDHIPTTTRADSLLHTPCRYKKISHILILCSFDKINLLARDESPREKTRPKT